MNIILAIISALIGAPRVFGVKTQAYQAVAHLWVGGLLGAYFVTFTNYEAESPYGEAVRCYAPDLFRVGGEGESHRNKV